MVGEENPPSGLGCSPTLHEINWQKTLKALEIAPNVAYDDAMKGFDKIWCGEGLSPLEVILLITWKVRRRMGIIPRWLFCYFLQTIFFICTQTKKQNKTKTRHHLNVVSMTKTSNFEVEMSCVKWT